MLDNIQKWLIYVILYHFMNHKLMSSHFSSFTFFFSRSLALKDLVTWTGSEKNLRSPHPRVSKWMKLASSWGMSWLCLGIGHLLDMANCHTWGWFAPENMWIWSFHGSFRKTSGKKHWEIKALLGDMLVLGVAIKLETRIFLHDTHLFIWICLRLDSKVPIFTTWIRRCYACPSRLDQSNAK